MRKVSAITFVRCLTGDVRWTRRPSLEWCHTLGPCRGKGRLNYRGVAMLPQGVWPQW